MPNAEQRCCIAQDVISVIDQRQANVCVGWTQMSGGITITRSSANISINNNDCGPAESKRTA